MIETATFWKDGPEIETGELRTEDIGTEVFFLPAAAHTEKDGTLHQHPAAAAVAPQGGRAAGRRAQRPVVLLPPRPDASGRSSPGSTDPRDRPLLDLTWDYPDRGRSPSPTPRRCSREINGYRRRRQPLSSYTELKDDGSTALRLLDLLRRLRRRGQPGRPAQARRRAELGGAPSGAGRGRRTGASSTTAPRPTRDGKPWSERKAYVWWDAEQGSGPGTTCPTSSRQSRPTTGRPRAPAARTRIAGADPFIMQTDGKAWLYAPAGLADGPLPAHYEPAESPVPNPLYGQQANPARQVYDRARTTGSTPRQARRAEVFPYVFTTYRLTEHHTAGGMSRWLPYLVGAAAGVLLRGLARAGRASAGWSTSGGRRSSPRARRSRRGCW